MIRQGINDFCPSIFNPQGFGRLGTMSNIRTTESYDRGDTAATSVRPMPQRTPKMDLKIYYYFFKNKLLPQSQCAFDLESGKFYLG
jgi:hypothetical protein